MVQAWQVEHLFCVTSVLYLLKLWVWVGRVNSWREEMVSCVALPEAATFLKARGSAGAAHELLRARLRRGGSPTRTDRGSAGGGGGGGSKRHQSLFAIRTHRMPRHTAPVVMSRSLMSFGLRRRTPSSWTFLIWEPCPNRNLGWSSHQVSCEISVQVVRRLSEVDRDMLRGSASALRSVWALGGGIPLSASLTSCGSLWRLSPMTRNMVGRKKLYAMSSSVKSLDVFISHTWLSKGRQHAQRMACDL